MQAIIQHKHGAPDALGLPERSGTAEEKMKSIQEPVGPLVAAATGGAR